MSNGTNGTQTWSISGRINPASVGSGTNVTLTGMGLNKTASTDTNGDYSVGGLANGEYTVTPTRTDYRFTPASQDVTINGQNVTNVDFEALPPTPHNLRVVTP